MAQRSEKRSPRDQCNVPACVPHNQHEIFFLDSLPTSNFMKFSKNVAKVHVISEKKKSENLTDQNKNLLLEAMF